MKNNEIEDYIETIISDLDRTIDRVFERGYDDVFEECDDYALLMQKQEFKNIVVYELYENYFLPKRHEFELQILNDIIDAVVKFKSISFTTEVIIAGVIGNTVFDVLKILLQSVISKFKGKDIKREKIFKDVLYCTNKLEEYFEEHECASEKELEVFLGIDKTKFTPILKAAGFKCFKRKGENIWVR